MEGTSARRVILVVGRPGSGKSGVGARISERNELPFINVGNVLRNIALDQEHRLSSKVEWHLEEGELLTDDLFAEVISDELGKHDRNGSDLIVVDGAARTLDQFAIFEEICQSRRYAIVPVIVVADKRTCVKRLTVRGRSDDFDEMIAKRLKDYDAKTSLVIAELKKHVHLEVVNEVESDTVKAVEEIEHFLDLVNLHQGATGLAHLNELYQRSHATKGYYGTAWRRNTRERLFLQFVQQHGGNRIVDVGCRDGLLTYEIVQGKQVTAIDIDEEALRRYRERYAEINPTIYLHDVNNSLPLRDASQDIIIAGEVIEHLMSPEKFIAEVERTLAAGGMFIGSTPNAFKYDKRVKLALGCDPKDFSEETHLQYFSRSSIMRLLSRKFSHIEIYAYAGDSLITFLSNVRSDGYIWKCVKR